MKVSITYDHEGITKHNITYLDAKHVLDEFCRENGFTVEIDIKKSQCKQFVRMFWYMEETEFNLFRLLHPGLLKLYKFTNEYV